MNHVINTRRIQNQEGIRLILGKEIALEILSIKNKKLWQHLAAVKYNPYINIENKVEDIKTNREPWAT